MFRGKTVLDTGFIYAPYIPLNITPTLLDDFGIKPSRTPLEEFAEEVFAEEIESGELSPLRKRRQLIDHDSRDRYYGKVTVANL